MKYLVVVDMQNDFVNGSLGTTEAQKIVPAVVKKIEEYKKDGTIFCTLDTHGENYSKTAEGRKLPVKHCIKGTDGWELNSEVAAALGNAKRFEKNTFGSVELAKELSQKLCEGDTVELCGLCTDICVVSNALLIKAFSPETQIIVDEKCCAGVTVTTHNAAIETMRSCQITIV